MSKEIKQGEYIEHIHTHLLVVENRLECLKDYGYVKDCDALDILERSLTEVFDAVKILRGEK